MIVAGGMAVLPERAGHAARAIESLLKQTRGLDHLSIAYDGAAEGKFDCLRFDADVYFTFDDDLEYPPDYVAHTLERLEHYGGAPVAYHGGRVTGWSVRSNRVKYSAKVRVLDDTRRDLLNCNWLGTGCAAWYRDVFPIERENFDDINMADCQFASGLKYHGLSGAALAHRRLWVKYLLPSGARTLYAERAANKDGRADATRKVIEEWILAP